MLDIIVMKIDSSKCKQHARNVVKFVCYEFIVGD
jgi:hypothetical protein